MNAILEDQKSIDDLPAEVLEKVFLALDAKSLKNCCLVNKKWNNVIGQSSSVMKKLPLRLLANLVANDGMSWSDIYHATKNFKRKFHAIRIVEVFLVGENSLDEYAIKTLNKLAAECRQIQFSYCFLINKISMESLKFPLLESAEIKWANVELASEILKVLSSSQLKHFSYAGRSEFSELMTFLSTQTKLTKLDLTFLDRNISNGCLSDIERIQIPLKTLSLTMLNPKKDSEPIVAFISHFNETLEDLTLSLELDNICGSVFKQIFTKLNKLKSLSIHIDSLPQDISFLNKLRPNHSVKKFAAKNFDSLNKEVFNRIIELLPYVETLELNSPRIPNDALLFISNHLKRLTTLQFGCMDSYDVIKFDRVYLPSVKTIIFGEVKGIGHEQWKLIVDAMPNVESMSLGFVWNVKPLSCRSIKIISKSWPNLIHVNFGYGFVAYDQIFIELLRNCKNIKTLEFEECAFKSETSKAKILKCVKENRIDLIIH